MSAERIVGLPGASNTIQFKRIVNITDEEFEVMIEAQNEIFAPGELDDPRASCIKRVMPQVAKDMMKHGHQFLREMTDEEGEKLQARGRELDKEFGKGKGFFAAMREMTGQTPHSPTANFKKEQRRRQLLATLKRRGHKVEDTESLEVLELLHSQGPVPMLRVNTPEERQEVANMMHAEAAVAPADPAKEEKKEDEYQEKIEKARLRAAIKAAGGEAPGPRSGIDTLKAALADAESRAPAQAAG